MIINTIVAQEEGAAADFLHDYLGGRGRCWLLTGQDEGSRLTRSKVKPKNEIVSGKESKA